MRPLNIKMPVYIQKEPKKKREGEKKGHCFDHWSIWSILTITIVVDSGFRSPD
jgi:hypothetical protein